MLHEDTLPGTVRDVGQGLVSDGNPFLGILNFELPLQVKEKLWMAEKEVLLTPDGLQKLEDELEHLKGVKRREVAERIKLAISYGDISENSEYEDAKNEQAFVEGRILTLDKMLRNARIIQEDEVQTDLVSIGSTVKLKDVEFDEEVEYTIVGSAEADPANNKISNESPVGRSLIGKGAGSVVDVVVPAGTIQFQILSIKR